MKVQYGDACLSLQQVYEWTRKFVNGISSVTDSPWPGQAHRVVTPEDIAAVEAILKENRRVTVNEIACNGDYIEKWIHYVPFVFNKLRDTKYLRFSFDSPSYVIGHFQIFLKLWKRLADNWVNIVLKQTWGLLVCLGLSLCWCGGCSIDVFGAKTLDTRRIHNKCYSEPVHSGVTDYVCCFVKIFLFFPGNGSEEDFPVLCPSFGWTFKVGSSLLRWSFSAPETPTVHCWRRSELGVHLSLSYPLWRAVP